MLNKLSELYPNPQDIFLQESSTLQDALKTGLIVLDTNTLLLPYLADQKSLSEICESYKKIKEQNRLFVPFHVVREFAQNRPKKLGEILKSLKDYKSKRLELSKYRIFEGLSEYSELMRLSGELGKTIGTMGATIQGLVEKIHSFERNDPVTVGYRAVIDATVLHDSSISKLDFEKDYQRRNTEKIPPGYHDEGKKENAEGDLIIWHTILDLGKKFNKDLVFISHDGKPDWQYNVDKSPFQPRYELIDEYRRASNGKTFHIAKLQDLLEIHGASKSVKSDIIRAEQNLIIQQKHANHPYPESVDEKIEEMTDWLLENFEDPADSLPFESADGGYSYIWGGPYETKELLDEKFGGRYSEALIDLAVEFIERKYGYIEWSGKPPEGDLGSINLIVTPDYETAERVGASGTFQITEIEDEDGNSYVQHVDQGIHFNDTRQIEIYLKNKLLKHFKVRLVE